MYDEELEKVMLYYLIFEKEDYLLDEADFVNDRNKKVIRAINELKVNKQEISMLAVQSKIKANSSQVLSYLSTLCDYAIGTDPQKCYEQLTKLSRKRKIQSLVNEVLKKINEGEDIDILSQQLIKKINDLESTEEKEKTFIEQVAETNKVIEDNYTNKKDYSLYTDMLDLDGLTCGLHKEELTIVGARPRNGKNNICFTDSRKHCK